MQSDKRVDSCARRQFLTAAAGSMMTLVPALTADAQQQGTKEVARRGTWIPSPKLLASVPVLMRAAALPGLSMAVVDEGAVVWVRSFGVANASTKDPVRDSTLFETASISKPVFAYAALRLADDGRLDLDRPLVSYHKPAYMPDDPRLALITARHVLMHTSGLPNWGDEEKPETMKPAFTPGRFFSYSGEGYFWLQLVVEHVANQGLSAFMQSELFGPAGMRDSIFAGDTEHAPRSAFGHDGGAVASDQGWRGVLGMIAPFQSKWNKPIRTWSNDDWIRAGAELFPKAPPPKRVRFQNSASSLQTTAADYARFLTLVMERPKRAAWELREATRRTMISPLVAVQTGLPLSWGLGWSIERGPDELRVSHEGNNANRFTSYAGLDPVRRRGIVVLSNGGGSGVCQHIVREATGLDQLLFLAALNPPRAPDAG